jgi:hypothetical protein
MSLVGQKRTFRNPSRDFVNEDVFSSRIMSMHSSTHSSQINTVDTALWNAMRSSSELESFMENAVHR